ncbi:SPRY-domain-containing protein [Metschnikowia bicuspidata var. bicuspidata NRRL YB-4993]|uniref:SPRY-domain-containing protein n=1 Tax=Metschnikowia bicuspidata var. bicuspidata NRRL YB-4993 TaxID=869754 RepID=A0A1A0HHK3_9ASCO|nr:SPRY-domain-containing protein [Metschnikowia bicuspidata var. bicuspidata NRRL YB-4993]OBA23485.1 SPRY-domain-containing protein [Metschnikowia bicuspidata var. bicuspidata NRRL YB-4993]
MLVAVYVFVAVASGLPLVALLDTFRACDVDHAFLNDEESLMALAEEHDFPTLSPEEQRAYLEGEEFLKLHPPDPAHARGKAFTRDDELVIKDCGINAFEFEQEHDILAPRFVVEDRTEINFTNNARLYSTATAVLRFPLPIKNRLPDTVYFEVKVFEYAEDVPNAHFAIGLVTKPYPSQFRLPGYNNFSMAYESTGNLKINKPFPTPLQQHRGTESQYNALVLPPLKQLDVVGFGYVVSSGTYFITRNGKKLMDVMKGCHLDLYPAVGCFSTNGRFQVNFGQMGFVWIEANVRKYGFFSASDRRFAGQRGLASLPEYGNSILLNDKLLDKGDELPPEYPEEELDFFGRKIRVGTSAQFHGKKLNEDSEFEVKD